MCLHRQWIRSRVLIALDDFNIEVILILRANPFWLQRDLCDENSDIGGESSEQVQRLVVVDLPGALPLETLAWSPVE